MKDLASIEVEELITHERPFAHAPECYSLIDQQADRTMAVMLNYDL